MEKDKKSHKVDLTEEDIQEIQEKEKGLYEDDEHTPNKETPDVKSDTKETKVFLEDIPDSHIGWIKLNMDILPSLGYFYPHGTQIYLKPARVKEIRNFSSLTEDDSYTVNEKINELLSSCVRIQIPEGPLLVRNILEIDKIFLVLAIRDLTFSDIPNPQINPSKCPKCNDPCNIEIFSNNSTFFERDDNLFKYYDPEKRCFVLEIEIKESVEYLELTPPSIKVSSKIDNYVKKKKEFGEKIERDTLKYLKYLNIDWDTIHLEDLDRIIADTYGWSHVKYSIILTFINDFKKQIKMKTFGICDSCGARGVTVPFRFRGSFRSILLISDPYRYVK